MQINEIAAQIMEHLVTHDSHGYSQGARWGSDNYCNVVVDGKTYKVKTGDRDCSSAIISAYKAAGLNVNATYTGNMKQCFLSTGLFEWRPMSFQACRGDIYLNEACHTAMCTSQVPDMLAEFSISETGGIYGQEGDQTGNESHIAYYYDYPWDGILHFIGKKEEEEDEMKPEDYEKIANKVWDYKIGQDGKKDNNPRPAWETISWTNYDTYKRAMANVERLENDINNLNEKLQKIENATINLATNLQSVEALLNEKIGAFKEN